MNKKADANEVSLLQMVGIILVVILVFTSIGVASNFIKIFNPPEDTDGKNNFNALSLEIQRLIDSDDVFIATTDFEIYVPHDLIFVGYDFDKKQMITDCTKGETASNLYCHEKPCLCLHEDTRGNDFDDDWGKLQEPITECYEYNENVVFLAPFDDQRFSFAGKIKQQHPNYYEDTSNYENLFIYGDGCTGKKFGSSRLYIEKFHDKKTDTTYIYIDEMTQENREELLQRKKYLELKYMTEKVCRQEFEDLDLVSLNTFAQKPNMQEIPLYDIPMGDDRTESTSILIANDIMKYYDIPEGDAVNLVYGNKDLDMKGLIEELESRTIESTGSPKYPKKISVSGVPEEISKICRSIRPQCLEFLTEESGKLCKEIQSEQ